MGEAVAVALDVGSLLDETALPSTVIDASGESLLVVRVGALSVDQLRRVCPDVRTESEVADA